MSYDDQYDAVLNGPERVRVQALELTASRELAPDAWVEAAKPLEQYIIGQRAADVSDQIDAVCALAARLLYAATGGAWGEVTEHIQVSTADMRELVRMLSALTGGPPF